MDPGPPRSFQRSGTKLNWNGGEGTLGPSWDSLEAPRGALDTRGHVQIVPDAPSPLFWAVLAKPLDHSALQLTKGHISHFKSPYVSCHWQKWNSNWDCTYCLHQQWLVLCGQWPLPPLMNYKGHKLPMIRRPSRPNYICIRVENIHGIQQNSSPHLTWTWTQF